MLRSGAYNGENGGFGGGIDVVHGIIISGARVAVAPRIMAALIPSAPAASNRRSTTPRLTMQSTASAAVQVVCCKFPPTLTPATASNSPMLPSRATRHRRRPMWPAPGSTVNVLNTQSSPATPDRAVNLMSAAHSRAAVLISSATRRAAPASAPAAIWSARPAIPSIRCWALSAITAVPRRPFRCCRAVPPSTPAPVPLACVLSYRLKPRQAARRSRGHHAFFEELWGLP